MDDLFAGTHYAIMNAFAMGSLCRLSAPALNLNPIRPTIANSSNIQDKGVLQLETGYNAFPQHVPGHQQTIGTSLSYVPLHASRLDLARSAFSHQKTAGATASGVGTLQIGGKAVLYKEQYHRAAPGIAFQYEAELPIGSKRALPGYGQLQIFLLSSYYLRNAILDVIINGSLVPSDCQTQWTHLRRQLGAFRS